MSKSAPILAAEKNCWALLDKITDPEIPVLSITDLGIVRSIDVVSPPKQAGIIRVVITATYSGCPAMDWISQAITIELQTNGYKNIQLENSIRPAWTTDWMTEKGKEKLKAYGIAPPLNRFNVPADGIPCPQCGSDNTKLISEFGSTACKALLQCAACHEPFDYFKCH
jgi:ring-1,2-phenylacetyl-CoA epoxidase subunit PaaD